MCNLSSISNTIQTASQAYVCDDSLCPCLLSLAGSFAKWSGLLIQASRRWWAAGVAYRLPWPARRHAAGKQSAKASFLACTCSRMREGNLFRLESCQYVKQIVCIHTSAAYQHSILGDPRRSTARPLMGVICSADASEYDGLVLLASATPLPSERIEEGKGLVQACAPLYQWSPPFSLYVGHQEIS